MAESWPNQFISSQKIIILLLIDVCIHDSTQFDNLVPALLRFVSAYLRSPYHHNFEWFTLQLAQIDPENTIANLLLDRITQISSLDLLCSFIEDTEIYITPDHDSKQYLVHPESPAGRFVRAMFLDFSSMPFESLSDIWLAFGRFVGRDPLAGADDFAHLLSDPTVHAIIASNHKHLAPLYDIALLIDTQVATLTSPFMHLSPTSASASTPTLAPADPRLLADFLHNIFTKAAHTPPLVHYAAFLLARREGDYSKSFERLRTYFDYSSEGKHDNNVVYPYALLSLAVLQTEFGCFPEAFKAINEAISAARESQDLFCLNYALSFLVSFQHNYPEHAKPFPVELSEDQMLHFLKANTSELVASDFKSLAYLTDVKISAQQAAPFSSVFEALTKALATPAPNDHQQMQYIIKATYWQRLGYPALALLPIEAFQNLLPAQQSADEFGSVCSWISLYYIYAGDYDRANEHLQQFKSMNRPSLRSDQTLKYLEDVIMLIKHTQTSNFEQASIYKKRLEQMNSFNSDLDFEAVLASLELELCLGNYSTVTTYVHSRLPNLLEIHDDVYHQLRLMNLYAKAMICAGTPYRALSVAIRVVIGGQRSGLMAVMLEGVCLLAEILVCVDYPHDALILLDETMPRFYQINYVSLTAKALAVMSDAMFVMLDDVQDDQFARRCLKYVEQSRSLYQRIGNSLEVKKALAKTVPLYDILNDIDKREENLRLITASCESLRI
ncbi:hypothetical protein CANCADRAFT_136477 [Tortispora caseinolytica NRRL Y-17796]|uniref:Anaphase-promoting complex subunit 5 n=1 Tax=Tortispora caseinolytica NRRL Y-17796 TaxID=767744 RepID=A0A1E4TBW3_9ASCO|nr:hypothetical protein CANCADRAFT_136477 [Tortispora caseinolytica NRRL Y-17796]